MADETISILGALQRGMYSPTESMYGMGAQHIAQSIPMLQNPYASASSNIGHTLGAGLLSGLLAGYARQDAAKQNAELMPLMGQIMQADPTERMALAAGNARLSPLVQALAFQDYERKNKREDAISTEVGKFKALSPLQRGQSIDNKLIDVSIDQGLVPTDNGAIAFDDLGLKTPLELEKEKTGAIEDIKAQKEIDKYKLGEFGDYNPSRAKAEDETRKYLAEKVPSVKQFIVMEKQLPMLEPLAKMNTKSSDFPFIYNYVKALDDTAVKQDEINMAQSANPLIQKYLNQLEGGITGISPLTPGLKQQMLSELKASRASLYKQAKKDADIEIKIAKGRGLSEDTLLPFDVNLNLGGDVSTLQTQDIIKDANGRSFQVNAVTKELIPID